MPSAGDAGCPGPHTGGISRLSAETCYAISWPELSRPTPRIFAPLLRIRHRQTKPAAAPRRAAQITPRPLPTSGTRLGMDTKGVQSARYGPTQPEMGVVGCRLWLLAPLRARGKTPSGQVSRSREVYMCLEHAAHDSRREYPPAREPSDRPNLRCFIHAGSMSRASRKRT